MINKLECRKCGDKLVLGRFAYNQNTCFGCFKGIVAEALTKLTGEERDAVVWMMAITAELYGYKW